jgi:acyl carrier protein
MTKKAFDSAKIRKEARKHIAQIVEIPENDLKDDSRFTEDLGVDSMKALEIVASIEKKYRIKIPENKIPTIKTPGNVFQIIEKTLKK